MISVAVSLICKIILDFDQQPQSDHKKVQTMTRMNETIIAVKEAQQLFNDVKSSVCNHSRVLTQTHMQLASQLGSFPWEMAMF